MAEEFTSSWLNKDVRSWLEDVLVPVEPNPRFLRRLRGRLVHYKGDRGPSGWLLFPVAAMVLLLVIAILGIGLRAVLGLLGLIGGGKRGKSKEVTVTPVS